jgi:alkylation response protein AidB-like acyl-CoA dehydrogenase
MTDGMCVMAWSSSVGGMMPELSATDVLERVQTIATDVAAPLAVHTDREAVWPETPLRALQAAGLGGLVVPKELGGLGHDLPLLVQVSEILGQACSSTAICFGMHCVATAVIAAKATPDQTARYLQPINEGKHLTTLALSEPGTGVHFYIPQCRLDRTAADTYRVTGQKSFVTNGGHADSYVVSTASADPDAPPGHFSCVIIPEDADRLVWQGDWQGWGMRGNSARAMSLDGVTVPRRDLLGQEGDEIWYVFTVVVPYFLLAMAGTYLGIADAAFDVLRRHLVSRRYTHRGSSLSQVGVLQHRLGALWAELARTRCLVQAAATQATAGGRDAIPALFAAKAEVATCAVNIANAAMTMMGGIAYSTDAPIQRLLRDAEAGHVMSPTTDILRTWTGRAILDLPLLGD